MADKTTAADAPFKHADEKTAKAFDLQPHLVGMMLEEPFYTRVMRILSKTKTRSIPTAGVIAKDGELRMYWNDRFMAALPGKQIRGVLKHECLHLIFEHTTTRKYEPHKVWNYATDLAINSHLIGKLPEGCCMPGVKPFEDYPNGKAAEWYFEKLKQDQEGGEGPFSNEGQPQGGEGEGQGGGQPGENGEPSNGGGGLPDTLDDHSGWGEADEETKQIAKERMKQAVADATKEVNQSGQGWGSVSAEMRKKIMDMISPKVDWRKVLRYFIKTSQRSSKRSTVRRVNKRFPYIHAGKRVNRTANIAISIDQSGSVSDTMLATFFSELGELAQFATFTVIPFDTRVDESLVYEWKKGERKSWERVMCGGTCFNAPTKYVNERSFDGHIILTDLMAPKPIPSKCQRMWMASPADVANPYFKTNERVIAIEP